MDIEISNTDFNNRPLLLPFSCSVYLYIVSRSQMELKTKRAMLKLLKYMFFFGELICLHTHKKINSLY